MGPTAGDITTCGNKSKDNGLQGRCAITAGVGGQIMPCCSPAGKCGNDPAHCACKGCIDYRINVTTALTQPAVAGATRIEVVSTSGFHVGDKIKIGDELNTVAGFGSLLLSTPLKSNHPASTPITIVPPTPTPPPKPTTTKPPGGGSTGTTPDPLAAQQTKEKNDKAMKKALGEAPAAQMKDLQKQSKKEEEDGKKDHKKTEDAVAAEIKKIQAEEKSWQELLKTTRKTFTDDIKKLRDDEIKKTTTLQGDLGKQITAAEKTQKAAQDAADAESQKHLSLNAQIKSNLSLISDLTNQIKTKRQIMQERVAEVEVKEKELSQKSEEAHLKIKELDAADLKSEADAKVTVKGLVLDKMRSAFNHSEHSTKHAKQELKEERAYKAQQEK